MRIKGSPQDMLKQAKAMQERIQREISSIRVEASTGGGMVTVTMDGNKNVTRLEIEPEAAEDIEMLQDMVRGAVNEAARRVDERSQEKLGSMMGGMMGGLGLPPGLLQ